LAAAKPIGSLSKEKTIAAMITPQPPALAKQKDDYLEKNWKAEIKVRSNQQAR
jgi:hypothetical protein